MSYIFASLVFVLVILADQLSKLYIIANVPLANLSSDTIVLIDGVIDITHINNYGAAWGILGGYTWLLLALTLFIMVVCLAMIIKNGLKSKLLFWSVALILAGGIGNMIDRIFRNGAVVDFLQFSFWPSFPIFNIADIAVCVGSGLLILYFVLDIYKDHKAQLARFNETNKADK